MNKTASDLLIGDLLRGAGLVTLADLTNAVQVATKTGLPVGRVLVMLGLITPEVVTAALQAQSLIRERALPQETAKRALCVVASARFTFDEALVHMGVSADPEKSNKLGDLVLHSELITELQLADALNTSQHLGLPLGRIFVLKSMLTEEQVESFLEAQVMLRDGSLERAQVLEALKAMRNCGFNLHSTLSELGYVDATPRHIIRLGELVMLADLVSETDLLTAVEIGLSDGIKIGKVLMDFGFITEDILDAALRLQTMVSNNRLTPGQAGEALHLVSHCQLNLVQAIADVMEPQLEGEEIVDLLSLLNLSGLLTTEEFERLLMFKDTSIFETVLVETGLMSETTLQVAVCCHILMQEKLLTVEQAIIALHHWRWTGVNLAEIFQTMGWTAGSKPALVPGIFKWQSDGPPGTQILLSPLELALPAAQEAAEAAVTASLANAIGIKASLANAEALSSCAVNTGNSLVDTESWELSAPSNSATGNETICETTVQNNVDAAAGAQTLSGSPIAGSANAHANLEMRTSVSNQAVANNVPIKAQTPTSSTNGRIIESELSSNALSSLADEGLTSLSDAEGVTSSLTNYEWGTPETHQSWH